MSEQPSMNPVVVRLTDQPIGLGDCEGLVSPSHGALVVFTGVVRDSTGGRPVNRLDYESYPELAERQMQQIADEAISRWSIGRILMEHRTGSLDVGETSVVVAVTARHRDAAFEACRFCIDTLKQTVAIWKKELFQNGDSHWVNNP